MASGGNGHSEASQRILGRDNLKPDKNQ